MTYSTEFELGDGTEKFVWIRFDGGTPRLEAYSTESRAMMTTK